jgi:hypothetical protein
MARKYREDGSPVIIEIDEAIQIAKKWSEVGIWEAFDKVVATIFRNGQRSLDNPDNLNYHSECLDDFFNVEVFLQINLPAYIIHFPEDFDAGEPAERAKLMRNLEVLLTAEKVKVDATPLEAAKANLRAAFAKNPELRQMNKNEIYKVIGGKRTTLMKALDALNDFEWLGRRRRKRLS